MDTSLDSCCAHCPNHQLDHLGHHAVTCKGGGDAVLCHKSLSLFTVLPSSASGGQLEVGCGLWADKRHNHPADILVWNWIIGKPAVFDYLTVTLPLNLTTLTEEIITMLMFTLPWLD